MNKKNKRNAKKNTIKERKKNERTKERKIGIQNIKEKTEMIERVRKRIREREKEGHRK